MASAERRLLLSGLLLFFVGLVLGFLVHSMPNAHAALSAHLNAVQSGTFVAVLGLCWEKFNLPPRFSDVLSHAVWLSFWGLEAGMVLVALVPSGATPPPGLSLASTLVLAVSSIVMTVTVAAAFVALLRRPRLAA